MEEQNENLFSKIRDSLKVKNKERTRRKLIDAVASIIRTEGYTGLGVNKIAKAAGVHKKLIYRYFENSDNLVEAYVVEKDYWMISNDELRNKANKSTDLEQTIADILESQFNFFYSEKEMQQLILWEISGKSNLMKSISSAREHLGNDFLNQTDKYFKESNINFRALSAVLSAGIYYMILHAPVTPYCGIDLNKPTDRNEVKRTIRNLISSAFAEAKKKKSK